MTEGKRTIMPAASLAPNCDKMVRKRVHALLTQSWQCTSVRTRSVMKLHEGVGGADRGKFSGSAVDHRCPRILGLALSATVSITVQ